MSMSIRRLAPLFAVFTAAVLLAALPSQAGPPGENGPIVYVDGDGDLRLVNPDGTGHELVAEGTFSEPDVSPDGTRVLVADLDASTLTGPLLSVDIATGAQTTVVDAGVTSGVWSGDGSAIAYAADGLYVMEGDAEGELVRADVNMVWDWSPVDDRVLASRSVDTGTFPEYYFETVDAQTGAAVTVRDNGPGLFTWFVTGADFSPEGDDIVYSYAQPGYQAVVLDSAPSDVIDETSAMGGPSGGATWAPDGTAIAYGRELLADGPQIVVYPLTSGSEVAPHVDASSLDWAPVPTDQPSEGFEDVPSDSIYLSDILWLADEGITKGCNPPANTLFCPDDFVTRGQMAAFLVRAFGYGDAGEGDLFTDDDGSVFESDIDKLATAGVTLGCNPPQNDLYCPDDFVTRAQMAAFLHRAFGD